MRSASLAAAVALMALPASTALSATVPRTVGVIGGGIAGLSCARRLQQLGIEAIVYDTGKRGPGGRASSRMWRGRPADHAVQSVAATPGSAFHEWIGQLEADGVVRSWSGLGVLDGQGFTAVASEGSAPRYIGVGGMGAIADRLADGLDIKQDVWVSPNGGIKATATGWQVQESKRVQKPYDAVVVAHNGKCAERLTSKIPARDVHMLLRARFATAATGGGPGGGRMTLNSMYSLLLEVPVGILPSATARGGVDGAYVENEPALRYMGSNDAKYGGDAAASGPTECWTVLSSGAFGKSHKAPQEQLEGTAAETEVTALLLAAVERAVGLPEGAVAKATVATKLQLWGAAIPMNRWDGGEYVYSAGGRIGVAGDWLSTGPTAAASTVEAAWTSGLRLAEHMASSTRCGDDCGLELGEGGGRFVPVDAGGFGSAGQGKANWVSEPGATGSSASAPKANKRSYTVRAGRG